MFGHSMVVSRVAVYSSPTTKDSQKLKATDMEGEKIWRSTHLSLVDLFSFGSKNARREIVNGGNLRDSRDCSSSKNDASMVDFQVRVPTVRALRTVRGNDSVNDGQAAMISRILVPGLQSDLPRSPVWNEEDGHHNARAREVVMNPRQHTGRTIRESARESSSVRTPGPPTLTNQNQQRMQQATPNNTMSNTPPSYSHLPAQPWADNLRRPRSCAIAIKNQNHYNPEEGMASTEESNERMYDFATWRMYNRIVDHRRIQQENGAPAQLPLAADPHAYNMNDDRDADRDAGHYAPPASDYGEVFELDI